MLSSSTVLLLHCDYSILLRYYYSIFFSNIVLVDVMTMIALNIGLFCCRTRCIFVQLLLTFFSSLEARGKHFKWALHVYFAVLRIQETMRKKEGEMRVKWKTSKVIV